MSLTEINIREKDFHNKLQSKKNERFQNIFYKAIDNSTEDFFTYLKNYAKNSIILDYGCGIGSFVKKVAEYNPKKIIGIDISEVSIEKAKKNTKELKIDTDFKVENCEKTSFQDNIFDVIYGTGILHHLQIEKCLDEIFRILKPGGNLLFIEPLGTNPIINLYRRLTPKARSIDEHPLVKKDFEYIERKFTNIEIKYYGFLTLVFFLFYRSPKNSKFFKILSAGDQFLFKFKVFKFFAWSVLISAKKN
jgi:ubiquinone/menaquinone biosynthesis C-methylase UbiE